MTELVKKMQRRIGMPPRRLEKLVHIGDLGEDILLQSLTDEEGEEIKNYAKDSIAQMKYTVYLASPTLRELAAQLMDLEEIDEPMQVMEELRLSDVTRLAEIAVALYAEATKPTVQEVEALKK